MKLIPLKYNAPSRVAKQRYSWKKPIIFSVFLSAVSFFVLPNVARQYVWLMLLVIPLIFRLSAMIYRETLTPDDRVGDFMGWW